VKLVLSSEELLIAVNAYLAAAGLRGWYEPSEPLAPVTVFQRGKPMIEPLAVVGRPLPFPEAK
jgi:hypothetical protein